MIRVVVDDIAFVSADAVIRPTTTTMEPASASVRRLEQVAGPAFWDQLSLQSELAVGSAVVTAAGDLSADYVVHAVISSSDLPVTIQQVKQALTSALQRVGDWQLATVAVPPVGTGAGNLQMEDAAQVMVEVISKAMTAANCPREVVIVVDSEEDRALFELYLKRLPQ